MERLIANKKSFTLEDGRWMFALLSTTYEAFLSGKGEYKCEIEIGDERFERYFKFKGFHDKHFDNFLKKFKKNKEYREKWRISE